MPWLFITPCWPCSRLRGARLQLKGSFEQAVGDQWGGLNIGDLYQVLDRLARDGLIISDRQPQLVKPDRLVHRITLARREELDRWLNEPSMRTRGFRDDFFLKVMAAAQTADPALLAAVLRRQRAHLLTELRSLAEAKAAAARHRGRAPGHRGRTARSRRPRRRRRRRARPHPRCPRRPPGPGLARGHPAGRAIGIGFLTARFRYEASRPGNAWVLPRQNAARSAELCMASAPNVRNRGSLTATRPR